MHLLDATMFWNSAGGVRRVISTKHALLERCGWQHTVLAPGAGRQGEGEGHVDCGGIPLPGSGGYRVVLARARAARLIEEHKPDIIEAADPYTLAGAVLDAAARLQVPATAFCHSHLPAVAARLTGRFTRASRPARWAEGAARRYLVDLYSRFQLVLAPSRWMASQLQDWGVARVVLQPLGVDCAVFSPTRHDPRARHALMQQLGLDADTRMLVYCGRFAPEKNLERLVDAVEMLGPGHVLIAIGSGPNPPTSRSPRALRVLPTETDPLRLATLLASCDLFVHAGDEETFGLSVLEAMACGTPVVASAYGGVGELVDGAGVAMSSRRAADWAEAMAASLRDPSSHLVVNALERAHAHDWLTVLGQWLQRYQSLLPLRGGRRLREPGTDDAALMAMRAAGAP